MSQTSSQTDSAINSKANLALTPKVNPLFRLQFEKAQDCFVLLFPEGMVKLNPSAGEIMQLIDGKTDVAAICQQLQAKFPEAGDLSADVLEFITLAYTKQWLQDV